MTIESPEFLLLANCCRWNFASRSDHRLEFPPAIKWPIFVALARRHRVQGLVWNALAQEDERLPVDVRNALSSDARVIAATNLAIGAECRELKDAFDHANLPLLFIKGLTVGALAYRSPMLKMGWDIDLLVDAGDLAAAARILTKGGYSLRLPSNIERLEQWHARSKESVWIRDDSFHVELHTRLADNRLLIPTIDVHSPRQRVEIVPSVTLPTLARPELLAYLAVHGSSSAWFRLKWISDFAALLHGRSGAEIEQLYSRSLALGAGRAAGQALLLADRLFNVLDALPALRDRLASDRVTRLLCSAALRMLTSGTREPTERLMGTLSIHWTQLLLRGGLGFKASELWRQVSDSLALRRLQ